MTYQAANPTTSAAVRYEQIAGEIEALLPEIEAKAEESEALNRLSDDTFAALRECGAFMLLMPREVGGVELRHVDAMRIAERVSWAHASAGWCVIVNNAVGGSLSLLLSDAGAEEIFPGTSTVMVAGNGVPRGYARSVEGGYMIRGNWAYGSGIHHAQWIHSGCFLQDDAGKLILDEAGKPRIIIAHHPRSTVVLKGNWDVLGLRATGSFDYTLDGMEELFVPERCCYAFNNATYKRGGLQGSIGLVGYTAWGHTSWALGVGRRMLDELEALAPKRMDAFGRMSDSPIFRHQLALAEARYRSARAYVYQTWTELADGFAAGRTATVAQMADVKLAMRHIHDVVSDVGTFAYRQARGASLHAGVMQRFYRDIHSGTQHILMADEIVQECGRAILKQYGEDASWQVFGIQG